MDNFILSLDLSTACTGWSVFNMDTKELIEYGAILPKLDKYQRKLGYPEIQLIKMISIANEIKKLVERINPKTILIEEISGSKNYLGQKTLDGLHWIVLYTIIKDIKRVVFMNVTGYNGWRYLLGLKLSEENKIHNKENKLMNKKLQRGSRKLIIITPKHLAQYYVNKTYNTPFDVENNATDNDVVDSIAMASAYLKFVEE